MSVEPTTRPDTDLSASLSTTASAAISDFHTQLSQAHGRGRQIRPASSLRCMRHYPTGKSTHTCE